MDGFVGSALRQDVEPFGIPDGAVADIQDYENGFVTFPDHFGGIARDRSDARVRVVVGRLGGGKSLYLRRMQASQSLNAAVHAEPPARNLSDLSSSDVVLATQLLGRITENTEAWKRLWRAAIFRSATSFLLTAEPYRSALRETDRERLRHYWPLLGAPGAKRRITHEAHAIIRDNDTATELRNYLSDGSWADAEQCVLDLLERTRPLFLYVDAIDDNFKYAPAYWLRVQRGLFYAVMDLMRDPEGGRRLHVVIALRDIALASTRSSESGTRYIEETHVNILSWSREAVTRLLERKVERLPDRYFEWQDRRTVASWLGLEEITCGRASGHREDVRAYLIRHTRFVPRDVVILGNRLCRAVLRARVDGEDSRTREELVRQEVASCAREFGNNQIAQVANQLWSEVMPADAARLEIDHLYTDPNTYQLDEAADMVKDAIGRTGTEVVDAAAIRGMDEHISERMRMPVQLGNILWQNQLIGVMTRREGRDAADYYSLERFPRTTIPPSDRYVWNPLLFDCVGGLSATLDAAMPPEG